jgi:hypothetical protein
MAIIPSLPVILQNGITADATQVMANFNAVVSAVNAGAANAGINTNITQLLGLTVALAVNQGGTGAQILTPNGVLIGNGTSTVSAVAPAAAGTVLTSNGVGANPSYQTPLPSGAGVWWPTSTPPTGWIEANGQSTGPYVNLIPIYGANVPDMRGQFARGWDDGAGVDPGRALLSAQADAIASHTSTSAVTDSGHVHTIQGFGSPAGGGPPYMYQTETGGSHNGNVGTDTATTGITVATTYTGATETRPKNVAWMFIIKT